MNGSVVDFGVELAVHDRSALIYRSFLQVFGISNEPAWFDGKLWSAYMGDRGGGCPGG